jgi:protein-tyrosine-phosphatase
MREMGIDISRQHSKRLESIPLANIERIITLCGEASGERSLTED